MTRIRLSRPLVKSLVGFLLLASACFLPSTALADGAAVTGQYRNLFKEYLNKTDAEIEARIQGAWQQLFAGDPNSEALYYPVAGDMAYVPDINSHDVRSEGLSYGMMIAVQLDRKTIDRLNELINPRTVSGARYNAATQTEIDTEEITFPPEGRSHASSI